ncbi:MAG: 5-(carboxyamino)imidazole ribonucleotide synthase [Cyclobacteriaceae bacterium]|nr:5-(carboxyamino)imidazole ribonucleotide synthase [Cyclobacteriaceae bacterium]MDW8330361.1 5-(carboxyamino)imidazole ribonucleotide synthase [Cyclobacteriaceae bacterium]
MQQPVIGILGGGQLGRMLIQKGLDFGLNFRVMDPDANAPCSVFSGFIAGPITDYDSVLSFGKTCDIVTIEIENVNVAALQELQRLGKKIYPQPEAIALIQDKRTQKIFYRDNHIPTAEFVLTANREEVIKNKSFLPAVHKLGREGYDGRGVQVLRTADDLPKAFDAPGVLEKLIPFEKEIAVIVARNASGEISAFPPVEMVFHPEKNLVEYLFSPAQISEVVAGRAVSLARSVIERLNLTGLLAVEMFVTPDETVLVNEIAPRPHNSGHHTIEANITSQYEQHLRAILNWPLGDTSVLLPAAMINLLGEPGYSGRAVYEGMEKILKIEGVHVHLYGKHQTKPFRKMGHVTIMDNDVVRLRQKAEFVKQTLKVIA